MVGLGVVVYRAVLDFDKVADMHIASQLGARAQAGIRADHAVRANNRIFDMAKRRDARTGGDAAVFDHAVGGDADVISQFDAAFKNAIHIDADIAAAAQFATDVDARRIGQRDPGFQQRRGLVALMHALQRGELQFAIHAFGFPTGVGMCGNDGQTFAHSERDNVGEVVLALRILFAQHGQPARQRGGGRDEYAGVDFADAALGFIRILFFDNARDLAIFADDAAVTVRIVELRGEQGEGAVARRVEQAVQRGHADQRHIAIKHQSRRWRYGVQMRNGLQYGVARAQLRFLQHPGDVRRIQRGAHLFAAMPMHHADARGMQRAGCIQHMAQQRFTGQRMQHLGQRRVHALALAGGENDDIQVGHVRRPI